MCAVPTEVSLVLPLVRIWAGEEDGSAGLAGALLWLLWSWHRLAPQSSPLFLAPWLLWLPCSPSSLLWWVLCEVRLEKEMVWLCEMGRWLVLALWGCEWWLWPCLLRLRRGVVLALDETLREAVGEYRGFIRGGDSFGCPYPLPVHSSFTMTLFI